MKNLLILTVLITLVSCGKLKHEIEGEAKVEVPESRISFEPDFEKAAAFCDERYGVKTEASEDCFEDFRDYYELEIKVDLDAIEEFCNKYDTQDEIENCTSELLGLFGSMGASPGMEMVKPE